ncbi:MAG: YhgE/Pip domain-containing protein [Rhodoferax sp.]|nr:YhgE/Pip domain-containing protein [Rhodoferax sp.]
MRFFLQVVFIVRNEAGYLLRFPKKMFSGALLAFVPAMYCVLYITSVWDPETKTDALPVAVVNLDEGVQYMEHAFNVGWEITTRLEDSGRFGFVMYSDEQKARALVRQGKLAFAVIIPRDFSASAVPGAEAGAGKVVVYTSQGNNYETAAIARHFAERLGREINESLNERRWVLVLHQAAGSRRNVEHLHDAVDKLRVNARELSLGSAQATTGVQSLAGGARRLNDGVTQITTGAKQLGASLRVLDATWPSNADINTLTNRARVLENGHAELDRAMDELQRSAVSLRERVAQMRDESKDRPFAAGIEFEQLSRFTDALTELDADIRATNATQDLLALRAARLKNSVHAMAGSLRAMGGDERTVVTRFPKDAQLDELAKGANDVAANATSLVGATHRNRQSVERLSTGIELLARALPDKVDSLGGSAEGLANSVAPVLEIDAPVENSGSGFASNVVPGALWLGAAMAAFLIHIRVLPRHAQFFSRPAQAVGKVFLPACVTLLQALMVCVVVLYVLKIRVVHPWAFAVTIAVSSIAFLLIVFALTKAFGDAGKGIAMFLLAVQLSSSGGILPVELSGGLFAQISPWLPLTWVVESIKASMFGAFGGAWAPPLMRVALAGWAGFALLCVLGRWRFVKSTAHRKIMTF